jgi:hypothetical protein
MKKTPFGRAARALVAWCAVAMLVGSAASAALASEIQETDDFRDVAQAVAQYAEEHDAEDVLLVLDIDNTLLAMNQDLGSDQWFEWQKFLLESKPESKYLVADDFAGLLEVQGLLYNLARMHPPQEDLPQLIRRLQRLGVRTLVLTSRGPEFRVATERELRRADYDLAKSALAVRDLPGGDFLPYDLADLPSDGLTKNDVTAFGLAEPRPVSYANGVFMTAGQPKGAMLLTMLHHAAAEVGAVVYDDDNIRHVAYVFAAVTGRDKEVTSFHYTREDANVKRFQYGEKKTVRRQWQKLDRTLEEIFE